MTRRVAAIAVVVLVVLAGCSGGTTSDATTEGATTVDPAADGATTAGATTAGATTAETTTASQVTEQSWVEANRSVSYERLRERHNRVVENASSLEYSTVLNSNTGSSTETSIAANRETQRARLSSTTTSGSTEQIQRTFVANGTVYAKSGTADDPQYSSQDANMTDAEFESFVGEQSQLRRFGGTVEAFEFEYVGVEDGAYVFEGDSIAASDETSFDAANVTAASGTLVVDERGFVRELSVSLTVETAEGEQSADLAVETTGVGETTVEEPQWTDEL